MRLRHGWTKGSTMPSRYVHLNNSDVDDAILRMYGMQKETEKEKPTLPKKCPFCDIHNSPNSEKCYKCGRFIDLKKAIESEENAHQQNFASNKLAAKILVQMLTSGEIPKIPREEIDSLIKNMNL